MIRCYRDLRRLTSFEERYRYLRLTGQVGESTFGFNRHFNQTFYQSSKRWQAARKKVILRDDGCDLGIADRIIGKGLTVHHMNLVTLDDILEDRDWIYDSEYLICVSDRTHKAIHYGDESLLIIPPKERSPGDTKLW